MFHRIAIDREIDGPTRPESPETIRIIMKDGVIYKNALGE